MATLQSGRRATAATCPSARGGTSLDGPEPDAFIQAARAIPLQIDRHLAVADAAERADHAIADRRIERASDLVGAELQPGERVVVAHAADAEADVAQRGLRLLHHPQLAVGDLGVVRDARRQAGRRGFIPRSHAGGSRQIADLLLGEADLVERTAHAVLAGGLAAGTIVAAIVGVVAVEHHVDGARRGERRQRRIQLLLAVVAAIDGVGAVLGPLEFGRRDDLVAEREGAGYLARKRAVMFGIARAVGGDAQRPGTEHLRGDYGEVRAVDAAAEGDDG